MSQLYKLYTAYCIQCDIDSRYSEHDLHNDLYNQFNNRPVTINFIKRIVRTNFFRKKESDPLIVKLTGEQFLYEFFVYHEDFEGVYIKESLISRGGIRWSSCDKYRDEAFDLYKAQSFKNVSIIPKGAKGCFISRIENVKSSYLRFINSILEITDDIQENKIIKYPDSLDGDDTYFVIAPDKGTGNWLNDANELSQNRWIGSAFASASDNGFSHKKMGITSKGALVSAEYHCKRLNMNMNDLSTVGVGDMSGDVFGNGMLHSGIKLYAAFNHKEIFIDTIPNHDSYLERKRLFEHQLTWSHFNGANAYIYDRNQKKIHLDDPVRKLLQINETEIEPECLMKHILTMKIDMIWFGGIGTYIDIDGFIEPNEINAKIIIEGANLAVTQRARSQLKCAINTDYFDNSGGVQCSDYEVLLKTSGIENILDMQDDVERIILENMNEQNQLLDRLDNKYEIDEDCLLQVSDLQRYNNQLSRPEICELISLTKKILRNRNIDIPFDDTARYILKLKMPQADKYMNRFENHPFIIEMLRTFYTNYVVHQLGPIIFLKQNIDLVQSVKELTQKSISV